MALGKRKSAGEFLPALKFDARIGKLYLHDRICTNGNWESQQTNIEPDKFRAVFDLQNLQIGWINFVKGAAPELALVPAGEDPGEPPSDKHKEGVRVVVKMDASLGGDVRELLSTAVSLWGAMDDLHDKYLAAIANHEGCLPAVDIVDVTEKKMAAGASYAPTFKISGWMPRPPELPAAGIPVAQRVKTAAPPKAATPTRPRVTDGLDDEIPF
jgi:hypothetical protein